MHRLSWPAACGSSGAGDRTCVPCIARLILNHWTTREAPALGFADFFLLVFDLYFSYFLPDLYYFLPSADLRFCSSSFSSCFSRLLRLFSWDFSCLVFEEGLCHCQLPSRNCFCCILRLCMVVLSLLFVSRYSFFIFLFCVGIWLINNVLIVSGEQGRSSSIHLFSPKLPFHPGCHMTLSRVSI